MFYWDKVITVYNAYENPDNEEKTYFRHIMANCFVKRTSGKIFKGNTTALNDEYIIRIPKQEQYLPPDEWTKRNDKQNFLTIQLGDIVVLGAVSDVVHDLVNGQRMNDLKKKYKSMGVITVSSVNDNTFLPLPHYHIRG